MSNPDLNPTPEARLAMAIWSEAYARGRLGSMGFWESLSDSRKETCRRCLGEIAASAIKHGRTLEDMARKP
jgi:hypothetical protein